MTFKNAGDSTRCTKLAHSRTESAYYPDMTYDTQFVDSRHLTQVNGDCYGADRHFRQMPAAWHTESDKRSQSDGSNTIIGYTFENAGLI